MRLAGRVCAAALGAVLVASGCAVGPNYHRPSAPAPVAYKELAGWKPATPADGINRGAWWSVYKDPELDQLERQVALSNQNVRTFVEQYLQAADLVREVRAELFPIVGATVGTTRTTGNSVTIVNSAVGTTSSSSTQYQMQGDASWTIDVWGSIRRQLESQKAAAQVAAADLANALLSAQATLATDYFELRENDSLMDLLTDVVKDYQRTADITSAQYKGGTASRGDYMSAMAQLQSAQAQLIAVRETRAQYEHAIAVLTGAAPADLTIAHGALTAEVPVVPAGVPSELLERNPGIAAAERSMKEENALVGVSVAAYFPTIELTSLVDFASKSLSTLADASSRVWSLGGSATDTVLDFGKRSAAVDYARSNYNQAVATYRQTVLTALQGVEDQLVALHTLQDEQVKAEQAVDSSKQAAEVALAQYKAGTVAFTTVLVDDEAYLTARQTLLTIQQNRLLASVTLIENLGGGWDDRQLPPH